MTRPPWRKKHDTRHRNHTHQHHNPPRVYCDTTRKISWPTRRHALAEAARQTATHPHKTHHAYLCPHCWDWHLTTQPQRTTR